MKKFIIAILSVSLLVGCTTLKKCSEKYPPVTIVKDSIITHDTTIYVNVPYAVPGESIILVDTLVSTDTVYEKTETQGRAKVILKRYGSVISAKCICDSIEGLLRDYQVQFTFLEHDRRTTVTALSEYKAKYDELQDTSKKKIRNWRRLFFLVVTADIIYFAFKYRGKISSVIKLFSV